MNLVISSVLLLSVASCFAPKAVVSETSGSFSEKMLAAVNEVRSAGCRCGNKSMKPVAPLNWNPDLAAAAQRHAADMDRHDFFDHRGSDGSTMAARVEATGYRWRALGENIAYGINTVEEAVQLWIESPVHCKTLMDPDYDEIGAARQGAYWVQNFGSR